MKQARKRIRICLFCVVMLAVIMGVIYYLYDRNAGQIASDGTLVTAVRIEGFLEVAEGEEQWQGIFYI